MHRRTKLTGLVGAVLALGLVSGCGGEGGNGNGGNPPEQNGAAQSQPAQPPGGAEGGEQGVQQLQAKLDELTKASPVTFEPQSPELTDQGKQTLKQIGEAASAAQGAKLEVTTTAGWPEQEKSMQLAQQRTETVGKALADAGLAQERVQMKPIGNEGVQDDPQKAVTANIAIAQ